MSELRGLRLYTKETLQNIAHDTYGAEAAIEYACAATTFQSCSAGRMRKYSKHFRSGHDSTVYSAAESGLGQISGKLEKKRLHPPAGDLCPAGHNIIGGKWVYKVKADSSHKGGAVVIGWGQSSGIECGQHVCSRLQALEHPYGVGNRCGVQSRVPAARPKQRISERRCQRGCAGEDGTRIQGIR